MRWQPLIFAVALAMHACGGSSDSNDNAGGSSELDTSSTGFYAPSYGNGGTNNTYAVNLDDFTDKVIQLQGVGSAITDLVSEENGLVQVYAGMKVRLISVSKNECPEGLEGCSTTDSSTLGVGTSALVAAIGSIRESVKNQGERGTCVAFAFNAGLELLLDRHQQSAKLSEQNTYFEGKKATNSWDDTGLSPYATMVEFVDEQVRFVSDADWPYNAEDKDCSSYLQAHATSTCSPTEAQGGGSDFHQQDPHAESAEGYRIATAHQLYASIGRIKQALYRGYPVAIAINANYDFMAATAKAGVVSWVLKADDCGTALCGHEVLAVGYTDDARVDGGGYLIVKNSWGSDWGDNGVAYLTYEWLEHSLLDAQAVVGYAAR